MEEELDLNTLLELPNDIIKISLNYSDYINLISEECCQCYNTKELKQIFMSYFKRFNDIKFLYSNQDYCLKSSTVSEINIKSRKNNDPTANYVDKNIDKKIWANDFYKKIVSLSHKLNYQEAVYCVGTFFSNKTEDQISEKLDISRQTLQKIKKSFLVKIALEFEL